MGKVYLIVQGWDETYYVVKAFSRREDAERYAQIANEVRHSMEDEMDVEEVDLD